MIGWEKNSRGKANLKRWVLSFERNVETDNELRVSGGREFQSWSNDKLQMTKQ